VILIFNHHLSLTYQSFIECTREDYDYFDVTLVNDSNIRCVLLTGDPIRFNIPYRFNTTYELVLEQLLTIVNRAEGKRQYESSHNIL